MMPNKSNNLEQFKSDYAGPITIMEALISLAAARLWLYHHESISSRSICTYFRSNPLK